MPSVFSHTSFFEPSIPGKKRMQPRSGLLFDTRLTRQIILALKCYFLFFLNCQRNWMGANIQGKYYWVPGVRAVMRFPTNHCRALSRAFSMKVADKVDSVIHPPASQSPHLHRTSPPSINTRDCPPRRVNATTSNNISTVTVRATASAASTAAVDQQLVPRPARNVNASATTAARQSNVRQFSLPVKRGWGNRH